MKNEVLKSTNDIEMYICMPSRKISYCFFSFAIRIDHLDNFFTVFTLRDKVFVIKSCRYCTLTRHFSNSCQCLFRLDSPCLASLYLLNDTFNNDNDWVVRLNLLSPFKIRSPEKKIPNIYYLHKVTKVSVKNKKQNV